jgi:hypothetical protein
MNKILHDSSSPKVKFLTVVWGEKYIERFCSLSLPSFLAPGNIPALSESTQLEVVIMTSRSDIAFFESNISFQKLKTICPVRFVEIDDLITTAVYGVVLTLAYARPIIECGNSMLKTHFVFMNADFVLANGSLKSLARHIHQGRSIVLGPSYRSIAEKLEPKLEEMVDTQEGILDIPPRKLVDMALRHPHRTTVAKTFNQSVFSSSHPNQLFWQVDENTVVGRYFLIFMLCLKPERVIKSVNGFCDYSFIPDLCPSGDEVAMDDSDEFFMLELQSRFQETFMLRQGEMTPAKIADSLQEWSTAVHRRAAGYNIVFHSKDIPPQIKIAKAQAAKTVDGIQRRLKKPKSHQDHHYWVMGVEAWKDYRRRQGLSCNAPELSQYRPGILTRFFMYKVLWVNHVKRFYAHSCLSPNWAIGQEHRNSLKVIRKSEQGKSTLILCDIGLVDLFKDEIKQGDVVVCGPEGSELRAYASCNDYDRVVYFLNTFDDSVFERKLAYRLSVISATGSLWISCTQPQNEHVIYSSIFEIGDLFGNQIKTFNIYSRKNIFLYFGHRIEQFAIRLARSRFRLIGIGFSIPIFFFSAIAVLLGIIFKRAKEKPKFSKSHIGLTIKLELYDILEKNRVTSENKEPV